MKQANMPNRKNTKRKEAAERNEAWAKLSDAEKLKQLDSRFGKDQGASRQRARLKA